MTTAAELIMEVAGICHVDSEAGVIYGEAGVGKTEAIKQYAKNNPDVLLIEADLGYTAMMVFSELSKRLGIEPSGRIHELFDRCVAKLKNSGRLVIADEAENLPYKALELLRRLHDKSGVGILLVGMPRLISNIRGNRGEFAQLYSRIGIATRVGSLTQADSRAIVDTVLPGLNGLSRVFHTKSVGNARRLRKLLNRSVRIAQESGTEMNAEIIEAAAEALII
jgi:DNA transposition AAA+ family ATPase